MHAYTEWFCHSLLAKEATDAVVFDQVLLAIQRSSDEGCIDCAAHGCTHLPEHSQMNFNTLSLREIT
jgi:hypothetical protein